MASVPSHLCPGRPCGVDAAQAVRPGPPPRRWIRERARERRSRPGPRLPVRRPRPPELGRRPRPVPVRPQLPPASRRNVRGLVRPDGAAADGVLPMDPPRRVPPAEPEGDRAVIRSRRGASSWTRPPLRCLRSSIELPSCSLEARRERRTWVGRGGGEARGGHAGVTDVDPFRVRGGARTARRRPALPARIAAHRNALSRRVLPAVAPWTLGPAPAWSGPRRLAPARHPGTLGPAPDGQTCSQDSNGPPSRGGAPSVPWARPKRPRCVGPVGRQNRSSA
jgi:hypothetical protein